jgi:pimeloyl-ACP methyl ester carboxylesterase
MAEVLLIHGSCHGAWCWHRVIPALLALGHSPRAIDLPGRNGAPATLDDQAAAICAALPRPALVVGHSAAGYPITAAAQRDPGQIRALIYLCAYVPEPGLSLADMRRRWPGQPLAPALRLTPDRSAFFFDPGQCDTLFYHDCGAEDRALAAARLGPEPRLPQETPLPGPAPAMPRFYIRCTEDRAIPPACQAEMAAVIPPENRFALPTSHSPFFSAPGSLARIIGEIAARLR